MKRDKLKRFMLVLPILLLILFFYVVNTQKTMDELLKQHPSPIILTEGAELRLAVNDSENEGDVHWYRLGKPVSVGRDGQSHGLTRIETASYILSPGKGDPVLKDIPLKQFTGIAYLVDVSDLALKPGAVIPSNAVSPKLSQNKLPISMLALKTRASAMPADYDFAIKNFLSLAPETAKLIHNYKSPGRNHRKASSTSGGIDCLLLDLPAIDGTQDQGKNTHQAGRCFFGISDDADAAVGNKRILVESAWFNDMEEGYYYVTITPSYFRLNIATTGIVFRRLIETTK